jgi:hypothetical protein
MDGSVDSVAGTCPSSLTFRLEGQTVYTYADTQFRRSECADVKNGARVEVDGRRMSDGRVRADRIEVTERVSDRVTVAGGVEAVSGSCPTIAFRVRGSNVYTSSATQFEDGGCKDVKNGKRVDVRGRRMADGRVHADRVELEDDDDIVTAAQDIR